VQLYFHHGSSIACHRQCRLCFHVFIYTSIYLQYLWSYMYIPYWNGCSSASVSSLRFVESDDSVHVCVCGCACVCTDGPEAEVQDFHGVMQQSRSVVLEWMSPRRTDVSRYKVRAELLHILRHFYTASAGLDIK